MRIKKLTVATLTLLKFFAAVAQTNYMPAITNWGTPVYGSALSITLATNIINRSAKITLTCRIKNDSTNLVDAPVWAPMDFYVILTNTAGALYELTPNPDKLANRGGSAIAGHIQPGLTNSYYVPLNFGPDIKPGDYELIAKRYIAVGGKVPEIVSNTLKIKVE